LFIIHHSSFFLSSPSLARCRFRLVFPLRFSQEPLRLADAAQATVLFSGQWHTRPGRHHMERADQRCFTKLE